MIAAKQIRAGMATIDEDVCYSKRREDHPAQSLSGELGYHLWGVTSHWFAATYAR